MKLPKVYEPHHYENEIYALWEAAQAFKADPKRGKPRFSLSMPPPNETGTLHVGHALGITLQDIMTRHARLQGKDALWLPGTDHAAIATNAIIEKQLAKEGTNKHELGRDAFIARTKEFVGNSRDTIISQIRAMGASCDWSRTRYTLDDALNRSVNEVFTNMYNDGLIYRGHRIVNWDPLLETTVSDDEVVYKEEKTPLYTLKYGPFEITTARPETKFGDKYVVMHPKDKRYAKYKHGDTFEAEWINGKVTATVIKDEAIDQEFGTGVMTITPWHDHIDFEIAQRHGLEKEQVIDFHGRLMDIAGEFAGIEIHKARPLIAEKLRRKGLLVHVDENYIHNIALNDRGKGVIEPQIRLQWFVDVNKKAVSWKGKKRSLKEVMQAVIHDQDITIIPERFDKTYFHWIDNLRDWCISRQIWWGHRIPVWYRTDTDGRQETYVGVLPPTDQSEGWHDWEQDPDTLDTWFSSALWTWSTLIDPELAKDYSLSLEDVLKQSPDFKAYHPTTVIETGWDILFFWVARMILATTYTTGEVPFKTVYLHGLVRTESGKKMSKSDPETIIDPTTVIPEYGTDALRLAMVAGTAAGNDQRLGLTKIVANRNFCNKLWNIARFVEDRAGKAMHIGTVKPNTAADHWVMSKLQQTTHDISVALDTFRFAEAYDRLYHFVWDDFADWYIEASKADENLPLLMYTLESTLKLVHPFAPFVTETIWQTLPWEKGLLITSEWPTPKAGDKEQAKAFEELKTLVSEVRAVLKNIGVSKGVLEYAPNAAISENAVVIKNLARLTELKEVKQSNGLKLTDTKIEAWLAIDADIAKRYADKLQEKRQSESEGIARLELRLSNKNYVDNAPEAVVAETRKQLSEAQARLKAIKAEEARFNG